MDQPWLAWVNLLNSRPESWDCDKPCMKQIETDYKT
jgi:hypothetical protein